MVKYSKKFECRIGEDQDMAVLMEKRSEIFFTKHMGTIKNFNEVV